MTVETILEDARWGGVGLADLAERACAQALRHFDLNPDDFEISLLGCGDARIAVLNADFRQKPLATNVLSWPEQIYGPHGSPDLPQRAPDGPPIGLGDIAIAYETCAREATSAGNEMEQHVTHLIVHGLLHLLGYDHITDKDAALMEGIEIKVLASMGYGNPYGEQ